MQTYQEKQTYKTKKAKKLKSFLQAKFQLPDSLFECSYYKKVLRSDQSPYSDKERIKKDKPIKTAKQLKTDAYVKSWD